MAKKLITRVFLGLDLSPVVFTDVVPDAKVEEFTTELHSKLSVMFNSYPAFQLETQSLPDYSGEIEKKPSNLRRYKDVFVDVDEIKSVQRYASKSNSAGPVDLFYVSIVLHGSHYEHFPSSVRVDCDSEDETLQIVNQIEADRKS